MSFDADAATAAYMATLSPAAVARSNAYFEGGYWLLLWDCLVALLLAWLLLRTRLSVRMRELAQRRTHRPNLQSALYAIQYLIVATVLTLPWSAYEGYFREHQYGMSRQNLWDWLGDQGKSLLLLLIFGTAVIVAVYALMRRAHRRWWLWSALVVTTVLGLADTLAPAYLEPVFNHFYALPDGALKQRLLSLARANAIPAGQIYEFDASKRTTKMSAHVSGLFGTAQVSLNDNLIQRASPEEIVAVMGHEMGHYVMNHAIEGLVYFGILIMAGFALLSWSSGQLLARYGPRLGFNALEDPAGLPLLVGLLTLYLSLLAPLTNGITRSMEAQADAFGLNAARQPDGFAQSALHLSEYRKMHPGPIEELVFFDHPSGWNRIHRAMVWKAENQGAPDIAAYDVSHPGTPGVGTP
jgi:STE24 endopeptidase